MKKLIPILAVAVILTVTAFAADYTITIPARMVTAAQRVADKLTIQRGTNVTVRIYLTEVIEIDMRQRLAEQDAEDVTPIRNAWENATPAQKAAARTALGL